MKKWKKRGFSPIAAIIVCGFFFTGCTDGNNEGTNSTVPVTGVTLNQIADFGLLVDETKVLDYTVSPMNATNKRVKWLSNMPRVASVTDGVVTAVSEGTAIITVITDDGRKRASCTVTVGRIVVTGVTLPQTLRLYIREVQTLTPTVLPENAANKSVMWETSDSSKVTITGDGTVTGVAEGTATITVRTNNSMTATCAVTVYFVDVTGVTLDKTTLSMVLFSSQVLTPATVPAYATNQNVTWSSNKPAVASVIDGTVTAVGMGTATITVTTEDGGKTATCAVTVATKPTMPDVPMVWIAPDTFRMGVPNGEPGGRSEERPQHQVRLTKGFYMGTYQISQGVYKALTGNNPSHFDVEEDEKFAEYFDIWPVDSVSWYDAVEFCNRLSAMEELTPAYTITRRTPATGYPITGATVTWSAAANGYRLPTEAEWEYACRAGTTTPFNFRKHDWRSGGYSSGIEIVYPTGPTTGWGSDHIWIDWANFDGYWSYNYKTTSPDGSSYGKSLPGLFFSPLNPSDNTVDYPNAWGLYSMHGNLEEWCWDWFDWYYGDLVTDPKGPASPNLIDFNTPFRVTRGGSWYDPAEHLRSGARNGYNPQTTVAAIGWGEYSIIGFRVVRYGEPPAGGPSSRAVIKQGVPAKMKQGLKILQQQNTRKFDGNSTPSVRHEFLRRELGN
jgi:uncharacterized protein YjdB